MMFVPEIMNGERNAVMADAMITARLVPGDDSDIRCRSSIPVSGSGYVFCSKRRERSRTKKRTYRRKR